MTGWTLPCATHSHLDYKRKGTCSSTEGQDSAHVPFTQRLSSFGIFVARDLDLTLNFEQRNKLLRSE